MLWLIPLGWVGYEIGRLVDERTHRNAVGIQCKGFTGSVAE